MTPDRRPQGQDLPSRIPLNHSWYQQGEFAPWRIQEDPAFKKLTTSERQVYRALCGQSYLVRHSPSRRYIATTYCELADTAQVSVKTVKRAMKKILKSRLATRWHRGTPATGRSRYELPASLAMILTWRIKFSLKGSGKGE